MNPSGQRSRGQILRSRGIGVRVGTLIGVAWLAFGVSVMASAARVPIAIAGVVIAVVLLQRSRRLIAASRRLPAPNAAQNKANPSILIKFLVNFVFEIVSLNLALHLLPAQPQQAYRSEERQRGKERVRKSQS